MEVFQVNEMLSGVRGRVTTILAHVQLVPALLVGVLEVEPVDFAPVWLEWAALGERLTASHALVWTDTCSKSTKFVPELSFFRVCNFIDGNQIVIFKNVFLWLYMHTFVVRRYRFYIDFTKWRISPVCVLVCRLRSKVSLKPLPHIVQRYLLISLWHFRWRFSNLWRGKDFVQILQVKLWPSSAVQTNIFYQKTYLQGIDYLFIDFQVKVSCNLSVVYSCRRIHIN